MSNNLWNSQDPCQVAKGGTGVASTTAYGVICGGTTTTNPLQNAGAGTSGLVLTSNGASALPTWEVAGAGSFSIVTQVFTSNGTYTPTSGMKYCIVEVVGGGGGGGGCPTASASTGSAGSGGGGGGYSRKTISSATIGASQSVTVGAGGAGGAAGVNNGNTGGTSSVGALINATGGLGGKSSAATTATSTEGALGGSGSDGDFNTTGNPGGMSIIATNGSFLMSACGGSSFFGGAGPIPVNNAGAGQNGTSYGGGGGGGSSFTSSQTAQAGGNGFAGIVIVTEYIFS